MFCPIVFPAFTLDDEYFTEVLYPHALLMSSQQNDLAERKEKRKRMPDVFFLELQVNDV